MVQFLHLNIASSDVRIQIITFLILIFSIIAPGTLSADRITNEINKIIKQEGTLEGKVTDPKGLPIANVSIALKGTNYGSVTNDEGHFLIQAPAGEYTLVASYIGYKKLERPVNIGDGKNTAISFTLSENALALEEVVVQETINNKFSKKKSDYIARMPLTNIENPQVYSIITKELLEEQIVTDIDQAVRNSVGVIPVVYPSGGLGTTFRGFNVGIQARNGMETTTGRSSVDIANVERIEILKGPSGTLFGSSVSSFGGVVNLVTKRPMETAKTEVSYSMGSFNLHRITADVNTPLNREKTALFRLNAGINREKSFLDYGFNNSLILAPSLTYKPSDQLSFTIDAELLNINSTRNTYSRYDANSGITGPEDIKMDYRKAFYHEEADSKTSTNKIFAEAKVQLAKNWISTTLLSFVGEDVDHSYQYYPTWLSPTVAARSIGNWGPIYTNYTNIQENINGEFTTGSVKHKILVGANLRFLDARSEAATAGFIDTVDVTSDFNVLRKDDLDPHMVPGNWPGWHRADDITFSAYATDVVKFADRLSVMLSLRVDHFDRPKNGTVDGYKQTALAPKLGLVYEVVQDQVSVFGNYMSGFQNQAPRNQPDGSLLVLDPIYAVQTEGGIKVESYSKKISTTVSYYHIAINNSIRTNSNGFAEQDGKQVSKGIDIEVITNPLPGLNLIGGYAFNNNRIVKASNESIEGNKATGSPENMVNFWVSYSFQNEMEGLGLGVGGNYVDKNYQFSDNVFTIPAYTVFNTTIFFNQPKWKVGLKLNNLTNEKYWTIWGVPQAPTNFAANLTLRF